MTISSRHYRAIINRKLSQADENHQMILNAIRELGNCSASQIKRHLHETISQQIKEQYERGEISRKKMEFEIEEKTPVIRTIYRGLAMLKKEKLIEHNNNKYSISDKARSEVRY